MKPFEWACTVLTLQAVRVTRPLSKDTRICIPGDKGNRRFSDYCLLKVELAQPLDISCPEGKTNKGEQGISWK